MINNVVLAGRLTKDPELRYSSSNLPLVYFTLAINRSYADQDGHRQADFVSCVVFRKQAESMARYLAKGSLIGVIGRIQTRNHQGKDGKTAYITEVVCDNIQYLESRQQQNNKDNTNFNPNQNYGGNNQRQNNRNNNYNKQNNYTKQMNDNSRYQDFGQDFPSNLDEDDFFADVVNPFSE